MASVFKVPKKTVRSSVILLKRTRKETWELRLDVAEENEEVLVVVESKNEVDAVAAEGP